jgi:hypothetical protein
MDAGGRRSCAMAISRERRVVTGIVTVRVPKVRDRRGEGVVFRSAPVLPDVRRATSCLVNDRDRLLAFYDFPAEHWVHSRTTTRSRAPSPPSATVTDRAKAVSAGRPCSRSSSSSA